MRLEKFRVQNYRNVVDSDWIDVAAVTAFVGQNEAGKSNLFEALYCLNPYIDGATYNSAEDWPVDDWSGRQQSKGKTVCEAYFILDTSEIEDLFKDATPRPEENDDDDKDPDVEDSTDDTLDRELPEEVRAYCHRSYEHETEFSVLGHDEFGLDETAASAWAEDNVPKFVLIHDYEMSGTQVELDELKGRLDKVGESNRHELSNEDQTVLIVLDLAQIDLNDFLEKGETQEGRTIRSFDKRGASSYLTQQFQKLWTQKQVRFEIEIDGPTLNLFAQDEAIGFPVRLYRRSTGFRWYVSFAWKFTHASKGEFKDCILLLEEPGIHLHYSGQRDLLRVFEDLSTSNTILYTTHLASMVDQANPERVRIVESRNNHVAINHGVVSTQNAPMAVIETALGLTPDLSGMLGTRKVLIVEGGTDALILHKLSALQKVANKPGLSDQIYLWSAQSSTKTPMYAAFAIGQKWNAAVLLDTDESGKAAKEKIDALCVAEQSKQNNLQFHVLMLDKASGVKKTDVAIEDIFPDCFYRECVNRAYGIAIANEDLPVDGSTLIAKRVEHVLKVRTGQDLDKKRVLQEMLREFDKWTELSDLPGDTAVASEKLFVSINRTFGISPEKT